jgi:hypothetical protein
MAYERMTLSSFHENLKAGKYETATGARRAVGKANDWSAHDKVVAAGLINTHFGADSAKTAAPRAAKSTAKKVAKKTAKKAAAKAAPAVVAPKKVAKAAPAKRAVSRRTPTMKAASTPAAPAAELTDSSFTMPIRTAPALIGEAVLRQNNASNIICSLAALQSRDALEQRVYTKALVSAEQSFDTALTPAAAAPKPFVSLREQMATSPVPPASAPGTRPDAKAIEQVSAATRAMVGGEFTASSNATPAAQPLG